MRFFFVSTSLRWLDTYRICELRILLNIRQQHIFDQFAFIRKYNPRRYNVHIDLFKLKLIWQVKICDFLTVDVVHRYFAHVFFIGLENVNHTTLV